MQLCLHSGAHAVERHEVSAVPTPPNTATHYPIAHDALLSMVLESFHEQGYKIANMEHALTADGSRYFGILELESLIAEGVCTVAGLRNAHDKKFSAGLVTGSGIFVCDNLAFSGEIQIGRKHTRFIHDELPDLVHAAVGKMGDAQRIEARRFEQYQATNFKHGWQASDLMIEMARQNVVSWSCLGKVDKEYKAPSYPEWEELQPGVYRLMQAFTENMKGQGAGLVPRTRKMHSIFDQFVEDNKPVVVPVTERRILAAV